MGSFEIQSLLLLEPAEAPLWFVIEDRVMGGLSHGQLQLNQDALVCSGRLSLQNQGGFVLFRRRFKPLNLSSYEGIALLFQGDGREVCFCMETANSEGFFSWQKEFKAEADKLIEVFIPFCEFEPRYRGRVLDLKEGLRPQAIASFALMLHDGKEGDFLFQLRAIGVYGRKGQF